MFIVNIHKILVFLYFIYTYKNIYAGSLSTVGSPWCIVLRDMLKTFSDYMADFYEVNKCPQNSGESGYCDFPWQEAQ